MSLLSQVVSGGKQVGQRIVIAGVEKVGKTTLMANAPRCLTIPMEMGFASIKTPHTPIVESWGDLTALLDEIKLTAQQGRNPYMSLGFDSATALEELIHKQVINTDPDVIKRTAKNVTMETCHGGYGKGYALANQYFDDFCNRCDELAVHAGINTIITCHVFAAKIMDPAHGEYDTWDLLLHSPKNQKTFGKREMITQWADLVGFLHEPLFVAKAEKGQSLQRGISANQGRMLALDRQPGWVAGNRYGLSGLIAVPPNGGWNSLAAAIYNSCGIDLWNRDV